MIRVLFVLLLAAILAPDSRGDDSDLALRVRVALALADCCTTGHHTAPSGTPSCALDWLVPVSAPRVEPAPAPKVAPKKTEPAAPAPAAKPAAPELILWQMWAADGRTWFEWREAPPKIMPPPAPAAKPAALDWRVIRPAILDPFAPCVGSV